MDVCLFYKYRFFAVAFCFWIRRIQYFSCTRIFFFFFVTAPCSVCEFVCVFCHLVILKVYVIASTNRKNN